MRTGFLASKCIHYFYLVTIVTVRTIELKLANTYEAGLKVD